MEREIQEAQKKLELKQKQLNESRPDYEKITDWEEWKKEEFLKKIEYRQSQLEKDVYKLMELLLGLEKNKQEKPQVKEKEQEGERDLLEKDIEETQKLITQLRKKNSEINQEEIDWLETKLYILRVEIQEISKKINKRNLDKLKKEFDPKIDLNDPEIDLIFKVWESCGFTAQEVTAWVERFEKEARNKIETKSLGEFFVYCRNESHAPNNVNPEELVKEYQDWSPSFQEYLDSIYPLAKRKGVSEINISRDRLTDPAIIGEFSRLITLNVSNPESLEITNCPLLSEVSLELVTNLTITNCPMIRNLKIENCGSNKLDLSGFSRLNKLEVKGNSSLTNLIVPSSLIYLEVDDNPLLTDLDLSGCSRLAFLVQSFNPNFLKTIPNKRNLNTLVTKSKLPKRGLEFLREFIDVEELSIEYSSDSSFSGSLEPLREMRRLKRLQVGCDDITGRLEYLPESLEVFSFNRSSESQLIEQLRNYGSQCDYENVVNYIKPLWAWKKDNQEIINWERFKLLFKKVELLEVENNELKKRVAELETQKTQVRVEIPPK